MAYPAAVREAWQAELAGIREKGIYKEERFIHTPQAPHITVEFPSGAELKANFQYVRVEGDMYRIEEVRH